MRKAGHPMVKRRAVSRKYLETDSCFQPSIVTMSDAWVVVRVFVEVDDCVIRQVDATIMYGYEYQGALSRLVSHQLTLHPTRKHVACAPKTMCARRTCRRIPCTLL
eukprot:2097553-Amphidinium_carterae.2